MDRGVWCYCDGFFMVDIVFYDVLNGGVFSVFVDIGLVGYDVGFCGINMFVGF